MKTAYGNFTFLMTEKLDESLLMLKNARGWTLQDFVSTGGKKKKSKG
jgi:hypothetical protein